MASMQGLFYTLRSVIILIITCLCACLLTLPQYANAFEDITLKKAVKRLAKELVESGKIEGKFVLVNPNDLYDAETRLSLPLALQLRQQLVTELTNVGVKVLLSSSNEDKCLILQGTWTRCKKELAIHLKVMRLIKQGPVTVAAASVNLPINKIDPEKLKPGIDVWARYLVRQLSYNLVWYTHMSIHIAAFNTAGRNCSPELGNYLAGWLRPAMAEGGLFQPLDQHKDISHVNVSTLRNRGTHKLNCGNQYKTQSLTACILDADAELKGDVFLHDDYVEIRSYLVARNGNQLSAASVQVPNDLFPQNLLMPPRMPIDTPLTTSQLMSFCMTVSNLNLELTSTRGKDRPYYHKGESIRFLLRLGQPAWVYLFNLNPNGKATLLYPVDDCGNLAHDTGFMDDIEKPLILPEDGYSFELVADAPFGTDFVWAVASSTPLHFPANLGGDWSRANNLVNRLRNQGKLVTGYAESKLELVTGK